MAKSLEEIIIYATQKHSGQVRKLGKTPYILHPLEVGQIISTMTEDIDIIGAGFLHDIVEDTSGTLDEIREKFGDRVAELVSAETEERRPGEDKAQTWMQRKQDSINELASSSDWGVKCLWLADKLANIRSLAAQYRMHGDEIWEGFHQKDPAMHKWYYQSVAKILELDFNRTEAYKELVYKINYIWPGTIENYKEKIQKFKNYSVDGCEIIGKGAKGDVYRYDDELIIKVYNKNNTYEDIERENKLARKAFIAGIPTAISFGIVTVGEKYGSMFELLNASTLTQLIARENDKTEYYADMLATLAVDMHHMSAEDMGLDDFTPTAYDWLDGGLGHEDKSIYDAAKKIIDGIPQTKTIIHGDFHGGNVILQNGEPLIIDMDRLSYGNPVFELCGIHMAYIGFYEIIPEASVKFNGFGVEIAHRLYDEFMKKYFEGIDPIEAEKIKDLAAFIDYLRLLRRAYKNGANLTPENEAIRQHCLEKIKEYIAANR